MPLQLTKNPKVAAWYSAARPRTLTATYVPLALAGVIALQEGTFTLVPFVLALIASLLLQVGANFVNEYFDYRRGADELKVAGQGMTIKNKVLPPGQVAAGAVVTVVGGALIGLYLLTQSGPLLFWIGLVGVIVVVTYTAGPFPLAYNGLGEVAVFVAMGPLMVLGAYYVMSGGVVSWTPIWASLPISFTVAAILHANNIRDMDADRAVNKRTLALILGRRGARIEYVVLVGGGYAALLVLVLLGVMPFTVLIAFITFPEAYRLIRVFTTETDPVTLHPAQGQTAKLHGQFGYLIVIGWAAYLLGVWLLGTF